MQNRSARESEAKPKKTGVRRGLVEQEILDHATRLFAQRGYAGTSIQDIAEAVGLTRPALYHYVKSKDDLLEKLVAEVTVVAATDIASVAGQTELSATERLRTIVRQMARHQGEQGERFQILLRSESDLPESVAQFYATNRRALLASITAVIEEGVVQGEFRPVTPAIAAFGTIGTVNWVAWWYRPGSPYDLDAICDELAEMAVHSLSGEQGRPASTTPLDVVRSVRREIDRLEGLLGTD